MKIPLKHVKDGYQVMHNQTTISCRSELKEPNNALRIQLRGKKLKTEGKKILVLESK
jgi:hypothetical protein